MGDAMCWSATADLVAGTGIAAIGVACVARVRRVRDLPLAALPLLLGAHQIIESVIWRSGGGTGPATLAWAVVALPVLPLWVALGVLCAASWCAFAAVCSVILLVRTRPDPAL
ncbi:hypothetical protein ACVWZD_006608 [Streptomyces sp. TE3672]